MSCVVVHYLTDEYKDTEKYNLGFNLYLKRDSSLSYVFYTEFVWALIVATKLLQAVLCYDNPS